MKTFFKFLLLSAVTLTEIHAGYFTVNSIVDLQNSLNISANNGEHDTILIQNSTYQVNLTIVYNSSENYSLFVTGQDSGSVVLNGNHICQIFNFNSTGNNAHISINNLDFTNGNINDYGGGIYIETNSSEIALYHCIFSFSNAGIFGGGAALVSNSGDIIVSNSIFTADSSNDDAGGLFVGSTLGNIILSGSVFNDNAALGDDAGGALLYTEQSSLITATNNIFLNNYAEDDGGGLFAYLLGSGGNAVIDSNSFSGNVADLGGGGCFIRINDSGSVYYTSNFAEMNSTNTGCGGGTFIYLNSGYLMFSENTFQDNSAGEYGGGAWIWNGYGNISITENIVNENNSNQNGGGFDISTDHGEMNLSRNIIYSNQAGNVGGGLSSATADGQLNINHNTIYGNSAGEGGGFCIYIDLPTGQTDIYNNILWNDSPNEISSSGAAVILCRYSDIENGMGNPWFGEGCIDQDPKFDNPSAGDFHLSWNNFPVNDSTKSPCIDTGDPSSPLDPDSTRTDMGALFFNQSTGVEENQGIEFNNNSEFQINCLNHLLEIYLPNQLTYPLNVEIYNINGQLVINKTFDNVVQNILIIDLKEFSFGVYILRISNETMSFSDKFILL